MMPNRWRRTAAPLFRSTPSGNSRVPRALHLNALLPIQASAPEGWTAGNNRARNTRDVRVFQLTAVAEAKKSSRRIKTV